MQRVRGTPAIALVTGAARRVGKSIALKLAANGYPVAVHCRHSRAEARAVVREIRGGGGNAEMFCADLSKPAECRKLISDVERKFGRIGLLVNSASVFNPTPALSTSEHEFNSILNANLKSVYFLSIEAAKRMIRRKSGVIINVEDVAVRRPYPRHAVYLVSKAGVAMLTRAFAIEFAPHVRVCGIAPGPVLLPEGFDRAERARAVARTLFKREGTPEDVADAALFLARNARYTTGTTVFVDGGRAVI